jgi:Glycosyltransferase family 9 (heptosyltransferase)
MYPFLCTGMIVIILTVSGNYNCRQTVILNVANQPIRQWQKVFEKILNKEDYLIVIIGPSEENNLMDIKKTLKQHKTFYINKMNLKTTSAILKQCNLFLGHDSGFAHIAAALNVLSVLVCGPLTLLDVWIPPTFRTKAIQFDSIDKIDVSLVAEVIGEHMQNLE